MRRGDVPLSTDSRRRAVIITMLFGLFLSGSGCGPDAPTSDGGVIDSGIGAGGGTAPWLMQAERFVYPVRYAASVALTENYVNPVSAGSWYVTNNFGTYCSSGCGGNVGLHPGIDWNMRCARSNDARCDLGEPAFAVAPGRVIYAQVLSSSLGFGIIVEHELPGVEDLSEYIAAGTTSSPQPSQHVWSAYLHLQPKSVSLRVNDYVQLGDQLGQIGDYNGPHLHFEMRFKRKVGWPNYQVNAQALTNWGLLDPWRFLAAHTFSDQHPVSCDSPQVAEAEQGNLYAAAVSIRFANRWSQRLGCPTSFVGVESAWTAQQFTLAGNRSTWRFPGSAGDTVLAATPDSNHAVLLRSGFWGAFRCLGTGSYDADLAYILGRPIDEEHLATLDPLDRPSATGVDSADGCGLVAGKLGLPDNAIRLHGEDVLVDFRKTTVQHFERGCLWYSESERVVVNGQPTLRPRVHVHAYNRADRIRLGLQLPNWQRACGANLIVTDNDVGIEDCTDECVPGNPYCDIDGSSVVFCGELDDGDVCWDRLPIECAPGLTCTTDSAGPTCIASGVDAGVGPSTDGGLCVSCLPGTFECAPDRLSRKTCTLNVGASCPHWESLQCGSGNDQVCVVGQGCVVCGIAGQACCVGGTCNSGLRCNGASCVVNSECEDSDLDGFFAQTCGGRDCNDGTPLVRPGAAEACNGTDDDCNGVADDGLGASTCGVGACQRVVNNCADGVPQVCVTGSPDVELCNGVDDDCNGTVDDACSRTLHIALSALAQAECVGGWQLVYYDEIGNEVAPSAPGADLDVLLPASWGFTGTMAFAARCSQPVAGSQWRDWYSFVDQPASVAGVASIQLDGVELADDESRVCDFFPTCSFGQPTYWTTPRVPLDAAQNSQCTPSPLSCPPWCSSAACQ